MKKNIGSVAMYTRITLSIVLMVVLPLVVFTMITSKTDKIFGIQSMVVLTGSMSPVIPQGSLVFAQKLDVYTVRDVISYQVDGITVSHRIVEVVKENGSILYRTKGDANNTIDEALVQQSQVLGKIQYGLMNIGNFILFLKTPTGFVSFIIVPLIMFVIAELWTIKKEIEKETEKKVLQRIKLQTQ